MNMSSRIVKQRNYGIDLLRIVSMFMVVLLHTFGQGGILDSLNYGTSSYYGAWFFEAASYCAADSFALISGYVLVEETYKPSRLIQLWFQVFFYSVVITIIFLIINKDIVGTKAIIKSFIPVLSSEYWYVTAYVGLFFFSPFLNKVITVFNKITLQKLLVTTVIVLSVMPVLTKGDLFNINKGYSMLWLIALYLFGAYIKRYDPIPHIKKSSLLLYAACVIVAWLSKIIIEIFTVRFLGEVRYGLHFISYTSPLILFAALFLFLFFSRLRIKSTIGIKLISFFAPISFGVYIIQVHPLVWSQIFKDRFAFLSASPAAGMILFALSFSLCVYFLFALIDFLRVLFFKLIRVPKLSDYVGTKLSSFAETFFTKNKPSNIAATTSGALLPDAKLSVVSDKPEAFTSGQGGGL